MTSNARFGTFDELIEQLPQGTASQVEPVARKLREVILKDFPEATEVVRLGDGAASYGLGPRKMSESYVYLMPQRAYVNLGFYHGASLPDPGILEGTGKKMRHVKVRSVEEAEGSAVQALIAAALEERRLALGIEA